ncbi:hypothetical protein HY604_03380 [Candidatus Peregrinibacteria bacterium]|nr:hypothetical protein [Candidatus Peregrinibacteria bacterium]
MEDTILELSERGQITIPQKIRKQIIVKRFICNIKDGKIVLEPLQTKADFLKELETAEKSWEKKGGLKLKEMKDKYGL